MDKNRVKRIMELLRDAGVDQESALTLALRIRRPQHETMMLEWIEKNPQAEPMEIVLKSRAIAGRE